MLIDRVYIANYKLAGQSLWCPVAYIEQSLFDMLGKIARKPVSDLLGGRFRSEIPVYLSGSGRRTTAEEEVDIYVEGIEETGAEAVKFKIGGRMSRNLDAYPGRTETMLKLARKRLGDDVIIYADANGSYNSEKAIDVGRFLEDLGIGFFEEPCPWQEYLETKRVTDTLTLPVACGEQDSSLWGFEWMINNRIMDIVQPDLNYNGGFIRSLRVANMALRRHMTIVPHNTQTGPASVNILHFASAVRNTGPYMEYPWREPIEAASWYTPQFPIKEGKITVPAEPGLGLEIDPDFLESSEVIVSIS
jgi:L-alanine-DL-glutamate epimerase-like enolase superfamily enzyme